MRSRASRADGGGGGESFVEACRDPFFAFFKCMTSHPGYYSEFLQSFGAGGAAPKKSEETAAQQGAASGDAAAPPPAAAAG